MWNTKPIQVFEHSTLNIGTGDFKTSHWESLGWYNENHGGKFFTLTPRGVKFNQYVGVIQVNNLTIEILPKIGRTAGDKDKDKWQRVLIDMLRECRWMHVYANEKAALRFKPNSILEAYLELFVNECTNLIREGLVKKYRSVNENCTALKGHLKFASQIQKNLIHQERFFTCHTVFDRENLFNQILLKAIKLIPLFTCSAYLKDKVYNLILSFPELENITVNSETFSKLVFNRKTDRYKEAIEIASMILLNYRPDVSSGQNHILAILFDMNDLWEEYVYRQLARHKPMNWSIRAQNSKTFWEMNDNYKGQKTIRPDIVIYDNVNKKSLVVDTKWKLPEDDIPADTDLKQMFVYNEYWLSNSAVLFYPKSEFVEKPIYSKGSFKQKDHQCGILKMSVLDETNTSLDSTMGKRLNDFFEKEILK